MIENQLLKMLFLGNYIVQNLTTLKMSFRQDRYAFYPPFEII